MTNEIDIKKIYDLVHLPPEEFRMQCKISYFQASGAGGQKRNRKLSAVRLTHSETGLTVTASELRESAQNLKRALQKLRLETALALPLNETGENKEPAIPISKFRVNVSDRHDDFPGCVLTAIHLFHTHQGSVGETSTKLGTSSAALIKFLKKDKAVWRKVQDIRTFYNHYPLK